MNVYVCIIKEVSQTKIKNSKLANKFVQENKKKI